MCICWPMAGTSLRIGVILAGGSGERFWPLSRRSRPKQLLKLADPSCSMLQQAVDRILPLFPAERIFVVTGEHLLETIQTAGIGIPVENVVAEPAKRNTAGALVYAAAVLLARYGNPEQCTMAVFTADHRIEPGDIFREDVSEALSQVEKSGGLAVIGIPPDRPATGYGYIEVQKGGSGRVVPVKAFREKPDAERASTYVKSGRHYWNSGMFFWRLDEFLRELEAAAPMMAEAVPELAELIRSGSRVKVQERFASLENISIDYALMEKAQSVWMVPAQFQWDDLGTWESLRRVSEPDTTGNVTSGDPVLVNTRNSIVVNEPGADRMAVVVVGMENVVVAVTDDGVLVVPADRSEDVAKAVAELKRRNARQT